MLIRQFEKIATTDTSQRNTELDIHLKIEGSFVGFWVLDFPATNFGNLNWGMPSLGKEIHRSPLTEYFLTWVRDNLNGYRAEIQ
jgi:hypothetical protein